MLKIENLVFSYPAKPLFDGLSFQTKPGLTLLRGEDGCGKTTLLQLLSGRWPAQAGHLWANGVALRDNAAAYQQQVFWADPQSTALDQTTVSNYYESLRAHWPVYNAALLADLIDGFSLTPHLHKPLYMLSAGSKRKVWLAAAFASGATVTLLDDPLAALDRASSALVLELLQEAAEHPSRAWVVACHEPLAGVRAAVVDLALR